MAIRTIPCGGTQEVRMVFFDSVAAVFEDTRGREKAVFAFPLAANKYHRFHCGLLTASGNELRLRNLSADLYASLSAKDGLGNVQVHVQIDGRDVIHDLQDVSKMTITNNRIVVFTQGAENVPEPVKPQPQPTPVLPPQPAPQKQPSKPAEANTSVLNARIAALQEKNDLLTRQKNAMEYAINRALGEQVAKEGENQQLLSRELQEKIAAFNAIRGEEMRLGGELDRIGEQIREAEIRRDAVRQKHQALQADLKAMRSQEEAATLDCGEASRELEELKLRLGMDRNVIELSESRWLKNDSVRDTLRELEQKISAVENRISLIINARERYNSTVQSAVMRKNDGTISMDDENRAVPRQTEQDDGAALT